MEGPLERVVIDANIAVALAVELPYSAAVRAKMAAWQAARSAIYVPVLWEYEVASALRKAIHAGPLTPDEAGRSLEVPLQMNLERVEPDLALHEAALRWAGRIGQMVAYDAQYMALAERQAHPRRARRLRGGAVAERVRAPESFSPCAQEQASGAGL